MEHVKISTAHILVPVLMVTKGLIVMVSMVHTPVFSGDFIYVFIIMAMSIISCYIYSTCSICLEINPACSDIICQNGGSCVYINKTSNAVCSCYNNFAGKFCEGIKIEPFLCQERKTVRRL